MIKVNLAPPTTKRPRRAAAGGGAELNLGLLFGGILAALVLIIGGWWLAMSLESRRLTAEIENNRRELERLKPIIAAGQRYRRERDELERRLNAIETVAHNQARPVYLLDAAGLINRTPPQFSAAIENETDVSPAVLADTLQLFSGHQVRALVYNAQTTGSQTEAVLAAAKSAGIPVVAVTETLPSGVGYVEWMQRTVTALRDAVVR